MITDNYPPNWKIMPLEEVAIFLDNQRKPIKSSDRKERIKNIPQEKLFPYYGATGQIGWINDYIFDEDLVLLAEDGGPFGSIEKPIAYRISGKSWVNNHAHVLKPKLDLVDVEWLYQTLKFCNVKQLIRGATRPKLNQKAARSIKVPVPPIDIQKKLVKLNGKLDYKINQTRKLNEEIELEHKNVIFSYLENFFKKLKGKSLMLNDIVIDCKNGFGRRPKGKEKGPIVLRLADVSSGRINLSDPRTVSMTKNELLKYQVKKDDLLIVRVNGSTSIVGRFILCDLENHNLAFNDHLIRIRFDKKRIIPEYIQEWSKTQNARKNILRIASTSAGQYTVNQKNLLNISIPVPSLKEQKKFINKIQNIKKNINQYSNLITQRKEEITLLYYSINQNNT